MNWYEKDWESLWKMSDPEEIQESIKERIKFHNETKPSSLFEEYSIPLFSVVSLGIAITFPYVIAYLNN